MVSQMKMKCFFGSIYSIHSFMGLWQDVSSCMVRALARQLSVHVILVVS